MFQKIFSTSSKRSNLEEKDLSKDFWIMFKFKQQHKNKVQGVQGTWLTILVFEIIFEEFQQFQL